MGKILYLGEFQLPDKNAAAQRVVNVSKILSTLEKEVILCGVTESKAKINLQKISGTTIEYYEREKQTAWIKIKNMLTFEFEKKKIEQIGELEAIICYNYDSLKLLRLKSYCKKNNIKLIGDITEWYGKSNLKFPLNIFKDFDTFLRMKYINKRLDYLICISQFLSDYYKNKECIYLPGMVDILSEKWQKLDYQLRKEELVITFIGNPGKSFEKERLDILVKAVNKYNLNYQKKITLKVIGVEKKIKEIILEQKSDENILFLGRMSHSSAIRELKNSDFSIIPREKKINILAGFPTKLGESFCCGIPVIATDFGDVNKYVKNGKNGFLIKDCTEESFIKIFIKISNLRREELSYLKKNAYTSRKKLDFNNFINEMKKIF